MLRYAFAPPTIDKNEFDGDAQPLKQDSGASRNVLGDAPRSRDIAHGRQLGFRWDGNCTTATGSSSGTAGLLRRQYGLRYVLCGMSKFE